MERPLASSRNVDEAAATSTDVCSAVGMSAMPGTDEVVGAASASAGVVAGALS